MQLDKRQRMLLLKTFIYYYYLSIYLMLSINCIPQLYITNYRMTSLNIIENFYFLSFEDNLINTCGNIITTKALIFSDFIYYFAKIEQKRHLFIWKLNTPYISKETKTYCLFYWNDYRSLRKTSLLYNIIWCIIYDLQICTSHSKIICSIND